jgi:signal transduction histidine kinase
MRVGQGRAAVVPILVGIVLLLVPSLAWLQYRWVGQLSQAERERMQRTLRTAASQFAIEFDTELSKAIVSLQVDGPALLENNWTAYAQRYASWNDAAGEPKLVHEVLLVDTVAGKRSAYAAEGRYGGRAEAQDKKPASEGAHSTAAKRLAIRTEAHDGVGVFEYRFTPPDPSRLKGLNLDAPVTPEQLRVRRWNASKLTFEPADWTPELQPFRATIAQQLSEIRLARSRMMGGRPPRDAAVSLSIGDDHTLVAPITLFEPPPDHDGPPKIGVLGFTLLRLDQSVIRDNLLPSLAARHLHGEDGKADYRIAVVGRDDPSRLIWESEPGAAKAIGAKPDVSQDFMGPRPDRMFVFTRNQGSERAADAAIAAENIVVSMIERRDLAAGTRTTTVRGRGFNPFEGRWTLVATHRAGSLEAAVASVRQRNLMLSSSILLLLTMVVGLIVVSARRAQELARQQMEFVAAVSHELRTPVSVIGTAAGNLADGVVEDPQRVRKYGETIQGEARRLGETVERVLQLAGIAAGRAAAAPTTVQPSELVMQSIRACQPEIEAAGTEVETEIQQDLPLVQGDVVALRSALQNLISNAVKYGGDARWLRVSVFDKPKGLSPHLRGGGPHLRGGGQHGARGDAARGDKPLSFGRGDKPSSFGRGDKPSGLSSSVVFSIEDRGLGIADEDRGHIFEPFYRGREAVSRQIHGSGLGLNLVQRIAEAHRGSVSVTSEPGKGSTFTLTLPAVVDRAAVVHVASHAEARS